MQPIIIFGNSVVAEIMYQFLKDDSRYHVVAFAADKEYIKEEKLFNLNVYDINTFKNKFDIEQYKVILAIGYGELNCIRERIFNRVKKIGFEIETYIHKDAKVYTSNKIGEGSIIMPNTIIEPFVEIGRNTVIWSNCSVAHHSKVQDNCWIATGTVLAGKVVVKNNCFIGVGVTIAYDVTIENSNVLGAGTMISKNTKQDEVYLCRNGEKHRFDSKNYANYFLK